MSDDGLKVVQLDTDYFGPVKPDAVLDAAKHLAKVVVIGETPEGHIYVATSEADNAYVTLLLQRAQHWILSQLAERLDP